jgi:hypothetical protein
LFQVIPQASTVGQGQILRIEIPSDIPQLSFKGFMIHARATNGRVVGRFASSADGLVKLINCDGTQDTATHANTAPKVDFGLDWQAPTDYLGDIIFKYLSFHFFVRFELFTVTFQQLNNRSRL